MAHLPHNFLVLLTTKGDRFLLIGKPATSQIVDGCKIGLFHSYKSENEIQENKDEEITCPWAIENCCMILSSRWSDSQNAATLSYSIKCSF